MYLVNLYPAGGVEETIAQGSAKRVTTKEKKDMPTGEKNSSGGGSKIEKARRSAGRKARREDNNARIKPGKRELKCGVLS